MAVEERNVQYNLKCDEGGVVSPRGTIQEVGR
jgi:hypothetical protein